MKIDEIKILLWLESLSKKWKISISRIPEFIGIAEIENRNLFYPEIKSALSSDTIDFSKFVDASRSAWALGDRFTQIRFTRFINNRSKALAAIVYLITNFPEQEIAVINRINTFISMILPIGFSKTDGKPDYPGAALLTSVILSSIFKDKFVDYRHNRWTNFAKIFGLNQIKQDRDYGSQIIESSKLAIQFLNSDTFSRYWANKGNLWDISGICWVGLYPELPEITEQLIEEFPEGRRKEVIHKSFERNRTLIRKSKDSALKKYGSLFCEVCGFDFRKKYGEFGKNFIEAHHKIPVSKLLPDHKSKVVDIALLCSNCHGMIHRGNKTILVEELQKIIAT